MNTTDTTPRKQAERLQRPREGRVLGGVAASIAEKTGASIALIRLGFLVTALLGGFGVVLYCAAWALLPDEGAIESPAEHWMRNLTTPGKRLGAFLIGLAGLVVLAGAAPASILAAAVLLAAAAILSNGRESNPQPTGAGGPVADEKE